jgi:hypothetical protein
VLQAALRPGPPCNDGFVVPATGSGRMVETDSAVPQRNMVRG